MIAQHTAGACSPVAALKEGTPAMKPDSDQPTAPDTKPATEAGAEGRSEIAASGGSGEKIGVVGGRSHAGRGAKASDSIWAERDRGERRPTSS